MSSALISDARLSLATGVEPTRWRDPNDAQEGRKPDLAWCREMERLQASAWFPGCLPGREAVEGARSEVHLRRELDARPDPTPAKHELVARSPNGPTNYALHRYTAQGASERSAEQAGLAQSVSQVGSAIEVPGQGQQARDPFAAMAALDQADLSTVSSQAEGVQPIQDLARPPVVVAAESHPLQSSAEPLASRLPMDGEPLERDQWAAMKPPVNVQPLSSQLAQPLEVPSFRAAMGLNGQPPDLEGPSQPVAMAHQLGSFAARSQSAEEPDSAPALPQTLAPSLTRALEQAVGAVSPRLHMSWDGQGVQVWLGLDGQPNVEALLQAVQRVLRQHGLQLSTLVCNGRVLVASRAAPQHPADAPLTQQDN